MGYYYIANLRACATQYCVLLTKYAAFFVLLYALIWCLLLSFYSTLIVYVAFFLECTVHVYIILCTCVGYDYSPVLFRHFLDLGEFFEELYIHMKQPHNLYPILLTQQELSHKTHNQKVLCSNYPIIIIIIIITIIIKLINFQHVHCHKPV